MSLFSWLFPASHKTAKTTPESSGLSRVDPTRPARRSGREQPLDNAQPANRKHERMARRELLYAIVRESMARAGVLTASYKFKVLSLDGRGRQFLVMVDLSRDCGLETHQLGESEAMIAQAAKARHDILVAAVYWRTSEHVAVGDPKGQALHPVPRPPVDSQPAAPESPQPLPVASAPSAATRSPYDPIQSDEVVAFKQAMAAGVQNPAAAAAAAVGVARHGPQSYTLLTGFEDTEIADNDAHTAPVLSGTQYGELNN